MVYAAGEGVGHRRTALRRLCAALIGSVIVSAAAPLPASAQEAPKVLVVSSDRVLRETQAAITLRDRERDLRLAFEADINAAKDALAAEEAELTRLRGELDPEEFDRRAKAFDQRARAARREAQRRAAEIQQAVREARDHLRAQVAPILIEILRERGADIVLDADAILIAAPSVDVTEDVIARFDAEIEAPAVMLPETADPVPPLPEGSAAPAPGAAPERSAGESSGD